MSADALLQFAKAALGELALILEPMVGGGSDRKFHRLRAGTRTWVGVISSAPAEMRAFLAFTAHFAAAGIPVPRILAADERRGLYVMEDLGEHPLSAQLHAWRGEPGGAARALEALCAVVRWLPVIQVTGGQGLDYSLCYEGRELNRAGYEADVAQFLSAYVPRFVLRPGPDAAARADLTRLVERLDAVPRPHFCYRDFQCRNIMWPGPERGPVFLDYQSGRHGPLHYDLVSLLFSPDTGLEQAEREPLVDTYLAALAGQGVRPEREAFLRDFYAFVLIRRLQALGAYAHLAVTKGKPEYLGKIAPAVHTLRDLFARGRLSLGLPALEDWLRDALEAQTVH
jgi:aminoglycoside/choline kinase family phosphotransferase